MKKTLFPIIIFVFLIKIAIAEDFLDSVFRPFFGLDIGSFYINYHFIIDFFIYVLIFFGVADYSLRKKFEGRGGRAIIFAIGLALTFSMVLWAKKTGFYIGRLAPLAAILLMALLAVLFFRFIISLGGKPRNAIGISYVITFLAIQAIMPELAGPEGWIATNVPVLWSILNILFLIALVFFVIELIRFFGKGREEYELERPERELEREKERLREDEGELEKEKEKEKNEEKKRIEGEVIDKLDELEKNLNYLEDCEKKIEAVRREIRELFKLKGSEFAREYLVKYPRFRSILDFDINECRAAIQRCSTVSERIRELIENAKLRGISTKKLTKVESDLINFERRLKRMENYFKREKIK